MRIGLGSARQLIDFSGGKSELQGLAEGQLNAAVALFNMLHTHSFAYLGDEVGMGKTYIALGVVSLMRHFNPDLRVLYITPSQNIQLKWQKEYRNFIRLNYRLQDHCVKDLRNNPAVSWVSCENLDSFAQAVTTGNYSDFFLRMTSFSLAMGEDQQRWKDRVQRLARLIPGCLTDRFRGSNKDEFKKWYAFNLNRATPEFDLVVIDEAHNFKNGIDSSTRNLLLSIVLGTSANGYKDVHPVPRVKRALLLSATPYDQHYRHLVNQAQLVGRRELLSAILDPEVTHHQAKAEIKKFMVRRLTHLNIAGERHTRNMYRREWRNGGVSSFEQELPLKSDLQRLIVGLFQKKVAECLDNDRFNNSFQMGMLASFESFMQTAKVKKDESLFDAGQSEDDDEKAGADTISVNTLVSSYKRRFNDYLPHPKMDALVDHFSSGLVTGEKQLIFARRINTVPELRDKFNDRYDALIKARFYRELPDHHRELDAIFEQFETAKRTYRQIGNRALDLRPTEESFSAEEEQAELHEPGLEQTRERKSLENFFAWFFVEEGKRFYFPSRMKTALISPSRVLSTLFEENFTTLLLGEEAPASKLADSIHRDESETVQLLGDMAASIYHSTWEVPKEGRYLHLRSFQAVQRAALSLLALEARSEELRSRALRILELNYENPPDTVATVASARRAIPNFQRFLELKTFFSQLRGYPLLNANLYWPPGFDWKNDSLREVIQLRELLAASLRLGQGSIDLFLAHIRARAGFGVAGDDPALETADLLISKLEDQRQLEVSVIDAPFSTFRELREIRSRFELLINVNFSEVHQKKPSEYSTYFAIALREQRPVIGMWGGVNKRDVLQFRMPGYPFILISTDVLQEGEDLHTFCSSVVHYGISWTPISMEQKTGRVDRVGSLVARRLEACSQPPQEHEKLQVYFPFLKDTVEVYQMRVLFRRMNDFIQGLHNLDGPSQTNEPKINIDQAMRDKEGMPQQIIARLDSPFEVTAADLQGREDYSTELIELRNRELLEHFDELSQEAFRRLGCTLGSASVDPVRRYASLEAPSRIGTNKGNGIQFRLELKPSRHPSNLLIACESDLGKVGCDDNIEALFTDYVPEAHCRLLASDFNLKDQTYALSVQDELLFGKDETQVEEVCDLIQCLVNEATFAQAVRAGTNSKRFPIEARDDLPAFELRSIQESSRLGNLFVQHGVADYRIVPRSRWHTVVRVFLKGRRQQIDVTCDRSYVRFTSQGASSTLWEETEYWDLIPYSWERNYHTDIVDFFFDEGGDLRGRIQQLGATMQLEEFVFYVTTLAKQMDRVEYLLEQEDRF